MVTGHQTQTALHKKISSKKPSSILQSHASQTGGVRFFLVKIPLLSLRDLEVADADIYN